MTEVRGRGYTIVKDDLPKATMQDFTAEKFLELKERVTKLEEKVKKQGDMMNGLNMQLGRLKKSKQESEHITIDRKPDGGENIG